MRNNFGQVPVYRVPMTMPMAMPMQYPYFVRRVASQPGQPYQLNISAEEVDKAVYRDLPTSVKKETKITGTTPQKIIKLKSGLEIPSYIIQRDIERKKMGIKSAPLPPPPPPPEELPSLHKIGVFASKKPLVASAIALVMGLAAGNMYYDMKFGAPK